MDKVRRDTNKSNLFFSTAWEKEAKETTLKYLSEWDYDPPNLDVVVCPYCGETWYAIYDCPCNLAQYEVKHREKQEEG